MTTMTMFDGAVDARMAGELPMQAVAAVRASTERGSGINRLEAEYLFLMDRTGQIGGEAFVASAVRSIRDHLLNAAEPMGRISEPDVDWLIGMVGDRPTAFGRALVFEIVRACDNAPERVVELAMRGHVGRCLLV